MTIKDVKCYLVGGAVRDKLLGKDPKDLDYVVVGADIDWMLSQGFKQVGSAFPVFLHPESGDEYALARREKKTAPGYKGFEFEFGPHVTLEDDLLRRDLTINSIAFDLEDQVYIDPYGGEHDLAQGIIRHTSIAFAEDPLRVLRVARFAARYGFKVATDTVDLCKQLVDQGEIDALSADRIWAEIEKLFSETYTSIGLLFLDSIGALETERLRHLVFKPVIDYKALYPHDLEAMMTVPEKMVFGLNFQYMSKQMLEAHRSPVHIVRESRFFSAVYDLLIAAVVHNTFSNDMVVATFDSFREEAKAGKIAEVKALVKKTIIGDIDIFGVLNLLDLIAASWVELAKLDFTEMTKGLPVKEIRFVVSKAKNDVVNGVFDGR